eukprot:CAMPEP_0195251410 /NCGR_PEP_ID=MMETSP0706-20130129/3266_1 /TAXON_ID=33640 /ORGANISM="Asterionellopsis glacialis, Strain CCMP134" /LENGTH=148 /DNA_ID=CAMNT_0040303541 /DNA_START=48 /DNA_END=494 /DNA_ORIENTATION=+
MTNAVPTKNGIRNTDFSLSVVYCVILVRAGFVSNLAKLSRDVSKTFASSLSACVAWRFNKRVRDGSDTWLIPPSASAIKGPNVSSGSASSIPGIARSSIPWCAYSITFLNVIAGSEPPVIRAVVVKSSLPNHTAVVKLPVYPTNHPSR